MGFGGFRSRALAHAGVALATIGSTPSANAAPGAPGPVPPTQLGMNLTPPVWFDQERSFANLAIGATWQKQVPSGWTDPTSAEVANDGAILSIPNGSIFHRLLTPPVTPPGGALIRCHIVGDGEILGGGLVQDVQNSAHEISFRWINRWEPTVAWLNATSVKPGSRLGPIDCREANMPATTLFDPAFVRMVSGYRVIRFKDWENVDANIPVTWAGRQRSGGIDAIARDGIAIEDMLALVRDAGVDPWFCIAWNADPEYIREFARMVREQLPPGHKVYVELGNEVWNWGYPVTHQAMREGQAAKLASDGGTALLLRYAQKTVEVMAPWERAFADRPGDLVRVIATQHGATHSAELVLGAPGVAAHVDALATAPYFGVDLKPDPDDRTLDRFFAEAHAKVDAAIDLAVTNKTIAHRFGKRYIAYEAGQHIILQDVAMEQRIERDPRMYSVYKHYLAAWKARVGDVLGLFHTSSPIDRSGAWGLVEHSGQPLSETPKLRAVLEAQRQ